MTLFGRLAEFILKGRFEAIIVVLVGHIVLLLAPLTIGLVTLKKGAKEGALLSLWAVLPVIVIGVAGNSHNILIYSPVAAVLCSLLAAAILRLTVSWPVTLLGSVLISAAFSLFLLLLGDNLAIEFKKIFEISAQQTIPDQNDLGGEGFERWSNARFTGIAAWALTVMTIISIILSRWMHAMVSNPNGFQQEFHALRLSPMIGGICLAMIVIFALLGVDYYFWAALFCLPFFFAGLGLLHFLFKRKQMGSGPIVALYVVVILFNPMILFVSVVGLLDCWANLRNKFHIKGS